MPNHVTSICKVTGPHSDVLLFAEKHILKDKDGDLRFAFESVIPRPAILDETESGSESDIGMAALCGDRIWTDFRKWQWIPSEVLSGVPFYHARQVRAWLAKERPECLEKAKKCLQAIVETGYPSWYEWSIANWGTKWNAYSYTDRVRGDGLFEFKFESAWSFPTPVFERLAEMYPTLVFSILCYDEGGNFAGVGEFNGKDDYTESKELATPELYEKVYGHKPDYDEDE